MAFEYGSQQIEIENPFRFEGIVITARGALSCLLGIIALLQVRGLATAGARNLGIWAALGGLLLLTSGIWALYTGLYRAFRFFVGRGMPADLVANAASQRTAMPGANTGGAVGGSHPTYSRERLSQMLLERTNVTFREPRAWLERMLHTFRPQLLFLHWELRRDVVSRFAGFAHTIIVLVLLGLAWFFTATSLLPVGTSVLAWMGWIATALLLVTWSLESRKPAGMETMLSFGPGRLAAIIVASAIAPFALVMVNGGRPLPTPPISPWPWLAILVVVGGIGFGYSLWLAIYREPTDAPPTRVSEYREHWQESVHPMDILRAVEMTLSRHRYREIPNRVYDNHVPDLHAQGSQNKGDFEGYTLQEIQPQPVATSRDDATIKAGMVAGQVVLALAAVVLLVATISLRGRDGWSIAQMVLAAVTLWSLGQMLAQTAHRYGGEVEFESDLISFKVTGTYSESRIATGMSIYDSTRSENLIVRSSLTPWLLVSRIRASTLAGVGPSSLGQPRLVLSLDENALLRDALIQETQAFLRDRQLMAAVDSEADLRAAGVIYQMNEATRARPEAPGHAPQIPHERRDDKLIR